MRIIAAIVVVTLIAAIAQPASAGMVEDCYQGRDPDLIIGGCTALIRSGESSGRNLAAAYSNRGVAYYDLGEYRRAIENYDQALRSHPGHANAYNNRGNAYYKLGEYRRAIQDFDQALRSNPGLAQAYNNRGNAYYTLREHRRAIEDYDQALRLDPGNASARANRAKAYTK